MIVKFHVMKSGELVNVNDVSDLQPFVKTYNKRYIQDVDGQLLEKVKVNTSECYGCTMSGPDAGKIAKEIGLKPGHHEKGMWFLSKSKYKKAIQYIDNSKNDVTIPRSAVKSPKQSRSLKTRRSNQLLVGNVR